MPNYRVTLNYTTTTVVNAEDEEEAVEVAEEMTDSTGDLTLLDWDVKPTDKPACNE